MPAVLSQRVYASHFANFIAGETVEQYVERMKCDGGMMQLSLTAGYGAAAEYGDHIELIAIADLFDLKYNILDAQGDPARGLAAGCNSASL